MQLSVDTREKCLGRLVEYCFNLKVTKLTMEEDLTWPRPKRFTVVPNAQIFKWTKGQGT